ncbi:TIGR02647 family protein [Pseudoalteromonas denitrificans]|uniref:TIGR02647 family protein n=1 Tax=Pseudoalteromonas denitrificans DSM 6059 TaxID=1123010 RepID=A0A1I1FT15_9GAMM|nr:TIGR02647 family protein [Pseudoalteromonas denitrificans]SFC00213.1 TIGR02647 family protein [Pseudoalteromonas denitrificans DSM 6059]
MQFNQHMREELDLILKFPLESMMQGLKVHQDADPVLVAAANRLFEKGIIDQKDGGYLTDLGLDLAEHAQTLQSALSA